MNHDTKLKIQFSTYTVITKTRTAPKHRFVTSDAGQDQ